MKRNHLHSCPGVAAIPVATRRSFLWQPGGGPGGVALAFGRSPAAAELAAASALVKSHGLPQLSRMLLNANEFVYVD